MELAWQTDECASAFAAAAAVLRGRALVEPSVARALAEPVDGLRRVIELAGLSTEAFLSHLLPLASDRDSRLELVRVVLRKTLGPRHVASRENEINAALVSVLQAFTRAVPRLEVELRLREPPLRMQWEARGPGLCTFVRRLVDERIFPERARVELLYPVLGGGGESFMLYNTVHLEALLAHADEALPEVVRLGWLLSTLNLELPAYCQGLDRRRIELVGPLAMVPLVLFAAEQVELSRFDRSTVRLALQTWRIGSHDLDVLAENLHQWGAAFVDSQTTFHTALTALDRMLA